MGLADQCLPGSKIFVTPSKNKSSKTDYIAQSVSVNEKDYGKTLIGANPHTAELIAKEIYKAKEIKLDETTKEQIKKIEQAGFGKFPVCIAKTQYSFSTDPKLKGAPSDHILQVREIRLSSGAEFVVVVCGSIMTMPGLPRTPAADSIKLNKKGDIEGLF